jgi:hypothetical protein
MKTKEVSSKLWKPYIIANPIYDTMFKRRMENGMIAKFFPTAIIDTYSAKLKLKN